MQVISDSNLKQIFPLLTAAQRKLYLPFLNLAMARFKINNERRIAMFLAQLAHESNQLTRWKENLNYSAQRLTQVWRRRFPTLAAAAPFANNPQALANKVYNGRMGNRVGTNDGWNYRGRAPMQATGRDMYQALTNAIGAEFGVNFVENPDLLLQPQYGFLASAWIFAVEKGCNALADTNQIVACTKRINGGTNGLAERKQNYERNLRMIVDNFKLADYGAMAAEYGHARQIPDEMEIAEHHQTEGGTDFESDYDVDKDALEAADAVEVTATSESAANAEISVTTSENSTTVQAAVTTADTDANTEKQIVAVEKPAPKKFSEKIKAAFLKFTGLNLGWEVIQQIIAKVQEVQNMSFFSSEWLARIGLILLTATAVYLLVLLVQHLIEVWRDKGITDTLVRNNSTPNNIVQLIDSAEIPALEAKGVKIVRR